MKPPKSLKALQRTMWPFNCCSETETSGFLPLLSLVSPKLCQYQANAGHFLTVGGLQS